MRKKVILHIGQTKTGTTTIQHFLRRNEKKLLDAGIFYPHVPMEHKSKNQHRFLYDAYLIQDKSSEVAGWDFLIDQMANTPASRIVVSEELFWHLSINDRFEGRSFPDWVASRLVDFDVQVICYLRRQDEWLLSWYNQMVKDATNRQSRMSIRDFVEFHFNRGSLNYSDILDKWAASFGRSNIIARPFVKSYLRLNDVVDDFLQLIGVENSNGFVRIENKQVSLSNAAVSVSRVFNSVPGVERRKSDLKVLMEQYSKRTPGGSALLSPEERLDIISRSSNSNSKLSEVVGGWHDEYFNMAESELDSVYTGLSAEEIVYLIALIYLNE